MLDAGSSPRVRGTRRARRSGRHSSRFIPACAGNTDWLQTKEGKAAVHPRVCGEHNLSNDERRKADGSSPRVRGTPGRVEDPLKIERFIPACAGNTVDCEKLGGGKPVHPRVCGEHIGALPMLQKRIGSSPRVRGTLGPVGVERAPERFIPACAGNTRPPIRRPAPLSVHPRVCGEHTGAIENRRCATGSSPRVRGTPLLGRRVVLGSRFIPACAGNTAGYADRPVAIPVHPRVCGEH